MHSNISIFIPHQGCPHACSFCNQKTISRTEKAPTAEDVRNILSDAYAYINDSEKRRNTEIAFFGGSFTAIDRDYMLSLLETANRFIGDDGFGGIRVSTRPDCIDDEILSVLKANSVTAIELGAQSMNDRILAMNDRGHTSDDVRRSIRLIKEYGFESGLQMMTGLYGSSPEDDLFTVHQIGECCPDTVRIYPTVILEGTRLGELYKNGSYVPYSFDECVSVCADAVLYFRKKSIRIIRMGLHAERSVEENMIGGFYHPAFSELVHSELVRRKIALHISENEEKTLEIKCSKKDRSIAAGHKRSNITYFSELGYRIGIMQDDELESGCVCVNGRKYDIFG